MSPRERSSPAPLAVLGAGSWGTTLAVVAARNGADVTLWDHDKTRAGQMQAARANSRYLADVPFPESLKVSGDLHSLRDAAGFLVAVPSHAFPAMLALLQPILPHDALIACATKGMAPLNSTTDGAWLLSDVARDVFGAGMRYAVLSGPSFAREVARGLPTALTVAAREHEIAERVAGWLRNDRLRLYTSDDVTGVEIGGAVKNVLAIATGICDGLRFGANARAALITRGLAEMRRFAASFGAQPETLMGLAGMGDLVLTCTDDQSRNRRVGLALAAGQSREAAVAGLGQVAEGVTAAREVLSAARARNVDMPITEQVCRVLFEGVSPLNAVTALLGRDPKPE